MKLQISACGNTMAPCWVTLQEIGYEVSVDRTGDTEIWIAESQGQRLSADDPCTLLGLAKLIELRGENWQVTDQQVAEFLQKFYSAG